MEIKNKTEEKGFPLSIQNESGAAMVIALLFMIVLLTLVPVTMQLTSGEFQRTKNFKDDQEVFYMAEAALEHGKSIVKSTDVNLILSGPDENRTTLADNGTVRDAGQTTTETSPFTWNGLGYEDVVMANGGAYLFRVHDNDDGDGNEFIDSDSLVVIEGIGTNGTGEFKTVYTMVDKKDLLPSASIPGAVTLTGPETTISVGSAGFTVKGADAPNGYGFALDGSPDNKCRGKSALSTEVSGTLQQVGNNKEADCVAGSPCMAATSGTYSNFTGFDGNSPSVTTGEKIFTAKDAEKLRDSLLTHGPVNPIAGSSVIINSGPLGTETTPIIVHVEGSATVTGTVDGYGVLIVDGDLDITGSLNWHGVIIVGACSTCPGSLVGTGSAQVRGAIVIGNSNSSINTAANFTGSTDILYSCEGINLADSLVVDPPFKVVGWNYRDMTGSAAALTADEDDDGVGGVCNGGSNVDDDDGVSTCNTSPPPSCSSGGGDDDDGGCGLGGDDDDD